jgi:hypothetical protein
MAGLKSCRAAIPVKIGPKIKGGQPVWEWKDSQYRTARWTLDWV